MWPPLSPPVPTRCPAHRVAPDIVACSLGRRPQDGFRCRNPAPSSLTQAPGCVVFGCKSILFRPHRPDIGIMIPHREYNPRSFMIDLILLMGVFSRSQARFQ